MNRKSLCFTNKTNLWMNLGQTALAFIQRMDLRSFSHPWPFSLTKPSCPLIFPEKDDDMDVVCFVIKNPGHRKTLEVEAEKVSGIDSTLVPIRGWHKQAAQLL